MVTVCYGLMAIICIARNRSIWCNVVLLVRTTGDIWWGFTEIYDTKSTIFGFAQQMGDTPQWQLSLGVYPVFKQTHFSTHCNKGSELENGRIQWMGWFSNGNSTGNYVFHRKRPRRGYLQIVGCVPAKFPFHIYICIFIHTSAYTCIFYILFLSVSSSLPFMHVKTNELM